ncbi:MAG: hypothetical protein M3342_09365 [Bacteroidota bacterium]|nr:hypothetical protein [Bacteroidota bacterium]
MAKGRKGSSPTEDAPKRTSIVIRPSRWEKVKYIAFMEKREISEIIDELLDEAIKKYEKKNGEIPAR